MTLSRWTLLCTFALVACGGEVTEYRLGMAGPFSEAFGLANKQGAELALEQINAAGGINGKPLHLEFRDDSGDGSKAAAIAQEFVDDTRISGVVGHVTSGAMVAAAKVYDGHLAALATTASSAELTGISRWTFRVISSDSANGVDLARFAERIGKRRAYVLYENDAYGRGLADAFRRTFKGEILGFDPIDGAGRDAEVFVSWAQAQRADLIFVAGTDRSGVAILRAARAAGVTADFLGGDGWTPVTADPVASEGALVGAPFTAQDPRPEAQRFVQAYREKYGSDPDGNAALAYDAVWVMAAALRSAGSDRDAVRDWLASRTTRNPVPGVTGNIAFSLSGDPIGKALTVALVRDGALIPVEATR